MPLEAVMLRCGHHETVKMPMERYITHALTLESGETLRSTGIPKSRNATPTPRNNAPHAASKTKTGIRPAVDGNRTRPSTKAGTATTRVTSNTLTQGFIARASLVYGVSDATLSGRKEPVNRIFVPYPPG